MTIHKDILEIAAQRYGIQAAQLKPVPGGHFAHVYEFTGRNKPYILRITPQDEEIDLSAMRANLEWMAFIHSHGGSVSRPLSSRKENLIELIERDSLCYLVVVFEKAKGVLGEELFTVQWTNELVKRLGKTVGQLHALAQIYLPSGALSKRPTWDEISNCFNPLTQLKTAPPIIQEKREQVMNIIRRLPKDRDSYGLIHTDLHSANFFVDLETNNITIFDFDDSSYGWYMMDIALILLDMTVLHAGPDQDQFAAWFLHWFLSGYISEKPINKFWIQQLPHFLKLLEIGLYIDIHKHYDVQDNDSWIGKFMPNRKERLERNVPFLDIDFRNIFIDNTNVKKGT